MEKEIEKKNKKNTSLNEEKNGHYSDGEENESKRRATSLSLAFRRFTLRKKEKNSSGLAKDKENEKEKDKLEEHEHFDPPSPTIRVDQSQSPVSAINCFENFIPLESSTNLSDLLGVSNISKTRYQKFASVGKSIKFGESKERISLTPKMKPRRTSSLRKSLWRKSKVLEEEAVNNSLSPLVFLQSPLEMEEEDYYQFLKRHSEIKFNKPETEESNSSLTSPSISKKNSPSEISSTTLSIQLNWTGFIDIELLDIVNSMKNTKTGIQLSNSNFTSHHFIEWLLENNFCSSRGDAVNVGQLLVDLDFIRCINTNLFIDGNFLYTWSHDPARLRKVSSNITKASDFYFNKIIGLMRKEIPVIETHWNNKVIRKSFTSETIIQFLMDTHYANSNKEAFGLGELLVQYNKLIPINSHLSKFTEGVSYTFEDEEFISSNPIYDTTNQFLTPKIRKKYPLFTEKFKNFLERDKIEMTLSSEKQLDDVACKLSKTVEMKDRGDGTLSFLANEAILLLCQDYKLEKTQALAIGKQMMVRGIIMPIGNETNFQDKPIPYTFQFFAHNRELNTCKIWAGTVGDPLVVSLQLLSTLIDIIYKNFKNNSFELEKLKNSHSFRSFWLKTAELQRVNLNSLKAEELTIFFVNIYHLILLHGLIVFGYPNNILQRKIFFDKTCYIIQSRSYSLDDIEWGLLQNNSILLGKSRMQNDDPRLTYKCNGGFLMAFIISYGMKSTPPIQIFKFESWKDQLIQSAKQYCSRHILFNLNEKRISIPKRLYRYYYRNDGITDLNTLENEMDYSDFFETLFPYLHEKYQKYDFREFKVEWRDFDWTPAFTMEDPFPSPMKLELDSPENLKNLKLEEVKIIQGHLVRRFSDETFVVSRYIDSNLVLSIEKFGFIHCWHFTYPYLIVYNVDRMLYCFDIRRNSSIKVLDSSPEKTSPQQIIFNPDSKSILVASSTRIKIWDIVPIELDSNTQSPDRRHSSFSYIEKFRLKFSQEVNIRQAFVTFLQRIIHFQLSEASPYLLVLASRESFQVWNLQTEQIVLEVKSTTENTNVASFTAITSWGNHVAVATSNKEIRLYSTGKDLGPSSIFSDVGLIAKLYMDEQFILAGDINGGVFIIEWKVNRGHLLNEIRQSFDILQASTSNNNSQIVTNNRVQFLHRFDRWVYCVTLENITVWDIFSPQSRKPFRDCSFKNHHLRHLNCDDQGTISFVLRSPMLDSNKVNLIAWSPISCNLTAFIAIPTISFEKLNTIPVKILANKRKSSTKHLRSSSNVT